MQDRVKFQVLGVTIIVSIIAVAIPFFSYHMGGLSIQALHEPMQAAPQSPVITIDLKVDKQVAPSQLVSAAAIEVTNSAHAGSPSATPTSMIHQQSNTATTLPSSLTHPQAGISNNSAPVSGLTASTPALVDHTSRDTPKVAEGLKTTSTATSADSSMQASTPATNNPSNPTQAAPSLHRVTATKPQSTSTQTATATDPLAVNDALHASVALKTNPTPSLVKTAVTTPIQANARLGQSSSSVASTAAGSVKTTTTAQPQWVVQVGTFANSHYARRLQQQLESSGYRVVIKKIKLDQVREVTQVLVGPQATRKAAIHILEALRQHYPIHAFVKKL